MLQDNRFRWLSRVSNPILDETSAKDPEALAQNKAALAETKAAQATSMHLYFPCGIIRGALSNLGIPCAVSADISNLPTCELLFSSSLCNIFYLIINNSSKERGDIL